MKPAFKKSLALVLAAVMLLCALPFTASATTYSGTCGDNLNWSLDTDTGVLNITGMGAMNNWSSYTSAPWYSYSSKIKTVNIASGVTTIGSYAFEYCDSLTSVTIPDSVTTIGSYAFEYCDSLTSVTIPDSVTTIGSRAFEYCDSLTSVTIPDSVTTIGIYAFYWCDSLTSVTIGNSVTTIGVSAFRGCNSLTSIILPDSVTSIGSRAFEGCDSLTSVTIGNSVTSIGEDAFYHCDSLTSITIPDSVTSIGNYAFAWCDSLTSITVDEDNKYFSSNSYGVLFNKDKTTLIQYPAGNTRTSYTIPDSVTTIGNSAFYDCDSLTSVTIPDSVTSIGDYAFRYCDSLADVYYDGTESQWKKIAIGSYNDPLKNATIHYNSAGGNSESVKIMSYNIYVKDGTVTDLTNGKKYNCSYENRVRYIVQNVHAYMPDSFGLQEVTKELRNLFETYEDLNGGIITANYTGVGDYRGVQKDTQNEASLIYYNHYKYTLEKSGTLWLSESGEKYSQHSKAGYLRIFTYALLKNKESGYTYLHVNTHMDHNDEAAQFSSAKIINFINDNFAGYPVVITGDFNQKNDTVSYKNFIDAGYTDARSVYTGSTVTFPNPFNQGKNGKPDGIKTIDHVFANDYFEVSDYTVYDEDYTNKSKYGNFTLDYPYPSDHHPVVVTLDVVKESNHQPDAYNLGEETYSFINYSDNHSDGHCFGMSMTSAGYHIGILDITSIGGNMSDDVYSLDDTATVKKPICRYQDIQGRYVNKSMVAGGSYFTSFLGFSNIDSDWAQVVKYVKNHDYDNLGTLQICFSKSKQGAHAVNFLRYEVVDGQERIYAYDNNFPDTEVYFYKSADGSILEAPKSTFSGAITSIGLVSVEKYFSIIGDYNSTRYIFADKDTISINSATAYPLMCGDKERVVFEIPEDEEKVVITPLVENAEFEYLNVEYSFDQAAAGQIGEFTLAQNEETAEDTVELTFVDVPQSIQIKTPSVTTVKYGETLVLQLEDVELPEGWKVEWSLIGNAVTQSVSEDGKECRVTSTASGNVSVIATLVDENGEPVLNNLGNEIDTFINLKSNANFWQKIVSFFKNLFGINRIIY